MVGIVYSVNLLKKNNLEFKYSSEVVFDYNGEEMRGEVTCIEYFNRNKENVRVLTRLGFLIISSDEIKRVVKY
jgi:hypothetical protein